MPELSNLLRRRLSAVTASWVVREMPTAGACAEVRSGAHPDPDTLTAYAEQLLHQDERNLVLSHLAACSQCREVVMLSLPEAAIAPSGGSVALPAVSRRRFFWTPGFGLAASAVVLAVAFGVLVEFPRKSATPVQNVRQEAPSIPAPPAVADNKAETRIEPAAPGTLASAVPNVLKSSEVAKNVVVRPSAGLVSAKPSATNDREAAPRQVYDVRPNATPAGAAASAALPPLSIAGVVAGERRDYVNDKMFSEGVASDTLSINSKDLPPAPVPRVTSPAGMFNANSATQLPEFAGLPTPTPGIVQKPSFAPVQTGHSLWGIGAIGHEARMLLQKRPTVPIPPSGLSFSNTMGGAGQLNPAKEKSQSVEVTAAAPPISAETELDRSSAFSRRARSETTSTSGAYASQLSWKVAGGKLLKSSDAASWVEAYPSDEGIEFAAFAAHGVDVWAGGRDAALIHTRDGGANWERLTLGASASGTIIRIEAGGLNVRVKSTSGQSWLSTDGGKSWTRQD